MADRKPKVFIGSSTEGLPVARHVQRLLEPCAETTVWNQDVFRLSQSIFDDLVRVVDASDFGVFVLSADDMLQTRDQQVAVPRDNVVLELGLFIGKLGRDRVFMVTPRGATRVKLPSDFAGVVHAEFDPVRQDGNLEAALGSACTQVSDQMSRLGPKQPAATPDRAAGDSGTGRGPFSAIYMPDDNLKRNVRKGEALREASDIRLLAHSGFSYLSILGAIYRGILSERLIAAPPAKIRILLLNPWSESALLIAADELLQSSETLIREQAQAFVDGGGDARDLDMISMIEKSRYYEKFVSCVKGYDDLKKIARGDLKLRLSAHDIGATLLLTDKVGFFEPYMPVHLAKRARQRMLTFEAEYASDSYFFEHCSAYFELLWNLAIDVEDLPKHKRGFQSDLKRRYRPAIAESASPQPPLVSQHESWISVDPMRGCPAHCSYCFLGPIGLNARAPKAAGSPKQVCEEVLKNRYFDKTIVANYPHSDNLPICIGNYTDICMTQKGQEYLLSFLREYQHSTMHAPVCIVTKARLADDFLRSLDDFGIPIMIFVSLSFLPGDFEKGVPDALDRIRNFERIQKYKNLQGAHFWRPILSRNGPAAGNLDQHVSSLKSAGAKASVVTGLKYGDRLSQFFLADESNPVHEYFASHVRGNRILNEIIEPEAQAAVLAAADAQSYPVFLHTSCAISFLLKRPDYNGTFRRVHLSDKCSPSGCPSDQRRRCHELQDNLTEPPEHVLQSIAQFLAIERSRVTYQAGKELILVAAALTQEQQTFLTQATSFPVRGQSLSATLEWIGSINR